MDTSTGPGHPRVWEPIYTALGRVVVEASRLEFLLEAAVARLSDPPVIPKARGSALVNTFRTASVANGALAPELTGWLEDCDRLLDLKDALVHAHWAEGEVWVGSVEGPRGVLGRPGQHRQGGSVPDDPDRIVAIAQDIADLERTGRSRAIGAPSPPGRSGQTGPDDGGDGVTVGG